MYPPGLQLYSFQHRAWLASVERALADFLADPARKRFALDAMPAPAREAAHELAAQYGLTTASLGTEPARHVEVFKVRNSARAWSAGGLLPG